MLEKAIEAAAVKKAKARGWSHKKIGTNGYPDRLFWQRRVYCWVEMKRPGEKPTVLQAKRITELKTEGERVTIAHSADECMDFLNSHSWWLNVDTQGL